MRKFFAYLNIPLLFILIASSFSASLVQISFNANKNYIIKELCENRFKPEMQCNGKCYLKKQLKQDSERKNENKNATTSSETINWFSSLVQQYDYFPSLASAINSSPVFDIQNGVHAKIYHPPIYAC